MDIQPEWVRGLREMGGGQRQRRQLWLFGSRARGDARESDVDIALALVPGDGRTDWALGNYFAFEGEWKRQKQSAPSRRIGTFSLAVVAACAFSLGIAV
jgi:predicted nucleotidyltransferase